MVEATLVGGVLEIEGSTAFQERVETAYRLLYGYCNRYPEILSSATVIEESGKDFEATTTPDSIIKIGNRVASWPDTDNILQTKILATYIAHESIHTYLLSRHDERWNTEEGEELAVKYQLYIARCLGVPEKYIVSPRDTVGTTIEKCITCSLSSIGKISALAIAAIVLYNIAEL